MTRRCFALIPAAGVGTRIGSAIPKQYLPVAGRPMIVHALSAFAAVRCIERIAVVIAPDDRWFDELVFDGPLDGRVEAIRVGGATRAESVANGLTALQDALCDDDWVLVHDAARCGIGTSMIEALIEHVDGHAVGGLLALPVDDTLKRSGAPGRAEVAATVDRRDLWRAQTPQMFGRRLLGDALALAMTKDIAVTDESSAVEAAGHRPLLVQGSPRNFKVTTADDLAMMEALLTRSQGGSEAVR